MDTTLYYKNRISAFDLSVEWFIKGANIGLIYALCHLHEAPSSPIYLTHLKNRATFVALNSVQTGGFLATWWFMMKASEIVVNKEHWGNYSFAGVATVSIWQKQLGIHHKHILKLLPVVAVISGQLGIYVMNNR